MYIHRIMKGYVLIVLLLSTGCCWAGKLCCDQSCSEVISYGTTITRHISKQEDYLSFPRNALVEVYAKNDDHDVWLVKYGNKKGFVPQKMILEKTVTCEELVYVDDKDTTDESIGHEQVVNNHGNHPSDPIVADTPMPAVADGDGEEFSRDTAGEDRSTDEIPTEGTEEEKSIVTENIFHATDSPTLPPQVDLHDGDKPVELVEQDGGDYRPQLDEDGEKIFEFKTEEEMEYWSDQMRERDHMINEQMINKDVELSYGEEEDDYEDDKMENEGDKKYEVLYKEENEEKEETEEERKDGEEEERKEEEYNDRDQEAQQDDEREGERLEESSGIGDDKEEHHMRSPDHENHQQEYLPSDVAEGSSSEEDHKVFEKIAEELAAAVASGNEQPTDWEDLVEQSSDDTLPVTTVTDSLSINPTGTLDHATDTSVVTATVDGNQMPDDKQTEGDDNGRGQPSSHVYDNEEKNETGKEQSQSSMTDETIGKKDSDTNKLPEIQEQYNLNSEASENQEKYEQHNLNISETSESREKYEQGDLNISGISESQEKYKKDGEILEKEEISNKKIESISSLESKLEQEVEHKGGDSEDVRHDKIQDGAPVVEEEAKKDEDVQQVDDNSAEQRDEDYSKKHEEGEDLEEQYLQQKDEATANYEQKDVEDKREGGHEDIEGEKKEEENDKPHEEHPPEPSQPFHQPEHTPSVTEELTSTLVAMTTHDIPVSIPSPLVATSSVSMTTDGRGTDEDGEMKSSEETVEVVHTSTATAATNDDQLRVVNGRQSEDVLMSEEHHNTKKSTIISILPSFLAILLVDVDDNYIYTLLGTVAAILLPCFVLSCRSSIKSNKQRMELNSVKARYRSAEEHVMKLEEENKQLQIKYNTELGKCQSVEELLSAEKQNAVLLQQANSKVNELLVSTRAQLEQYQTHNDQLVGELTTERQLHATQISATQEALQELMATRAHLQQAGQQVSELEATREQLEQEVFTVKQTIDELQAAHLKLQQSHDEVTQRCGSLDEQLVSVSSNLATTESLMTEKDDELKLLRECLLQLQSDESDEDVDLETVDVDTVDMETEGNAHRKVLSRKNSKIEKVHAMLDTTKVQTELKSVKQEKESLQQQLEVKIQTLQQFEDELEQTRSELSRVCSEQHELSLKHSETEIKLKTLTEYFENKEQNLHRKLGVEEAARQEIQSREATAMEKVSLAEEERAKEREELQQLRQQMSEIEKSLMQQVVTNDKRAQEALAQLRRTEQELRLANREISDLKKRLSGSRPTSPGGSETGRQPSSHPPMSRKRYSPPLERHLEPVPVRRRPPSTGPRMETRPPSAPRFPRTSSPSEMDRPPMAGRQFNDTYPGPSRPLPQPRDSYSLDDRDRAMLRGPDDGKGLPPPPLHHHPRLPPQKSSDWMNRPVPMSDRPPLPHSMSDHHPLPSRHVPPPVGPRGDPNLMPARRPPLYHPQPPPGPVRPPHPHHNTLARRPGPPPGTQNRQPPTEPAKLSDQHKMQV